MKNLNITMEPEFIVSVAKGWISTQKKMFLKNQLQNLVLKL